MCVGWIQLFEEHQTNSYGEIFESLPNLVGVEEEFYATGKMRYEWEFVVEKGGAEI